MATQVTLNSGAVSSAGSLKLQTNGTTDAVTIDTAQNMGLGVTPSAWTSGYRALDIGSVASVVSGSNFYNLYNNAYNNGTNLVYKTTGYATVYGQRQDTGQHQWYISSSGTAGSAVSGITQAMTLDASGRLGIGRTSPSQQLDVNGQILATNIYLNSDDSDISWNSGSGSRPLIRGNTTNNTIQFFTASQERVRIDSSGNLLVGQTSLSQSNLGFHVEGSGSTNRGTVSSILAASTNAASSYNLYSTGAGAFRFYVGMAGNIYATSTTITGISDRRLKENIRDLDDGLSSIMALQPRKFDWKEGKGADIKNARGFIAQEFETVFPDLIDEWRDPVPEGEEPYKSVRADLIPVLVKAIQEQQAIIETLTNRIQALENK